MGERSPGSHRQPDLQIRSFARAKSASSARTVAAPRLGLALLQFVDRSLRQTNTPSEFALAPTEHCPRQPYLGRKGLPVESHDLPETARRAVR